MKGEAFDQLVRSVRQAGRIRRGVAKASRALVFEPADVKAIRGKLGKSQTEFAMMIGVSVATLRNGSRAVAHQMVPRLRCCAWHLLSRRPLLELFEAQHDKPAYEEHSVLHCCIKIDPLFRSLRADQRFQDLLPQMDFPD